MGTQGLFGSSSPGTSGILCRSRVPACGVLSYTIFFVVFVYFIAFVIDLFVPRSIDHGP